MPHHICSQCFSSLTLAFALKIQSEKANKWLLDNVPKQTTQISGTDTSKNTQHNVPLKRQRTDDCEALADNATENRADHNEVSDSGDEEEQNVVKEETPIKAMELENDKDSVNTASTSYPMIRVKTIPKEDETGLQECRICNKEFLPSEIKQHMKLKCGKGKILFDVCLHTAVPK